MCGIRIMPDNFVREKRERRVETVGFFDQGGVWYIILPYKMWSCRLIDQVNYSDEYSWLRWHILSKHIAFCALLLL
jgi:hypothetical protein